ncbi:MAG TPA: circadian clock KaiB family protein [Segetibacter sp.]|nr:circadian clock KaiB family protein [Segetibacter sp.]
MSQEEQDLLKGENDDVDNTGPEYELRLFVTGASSNSVRAISNLKRICETHLKGNYSLEIIDVYQQKGIAETEQIIAIPLLIKTLPLPKRRLIGDMSDENKVLLGLGIIA